MGVISPGRDCLDSAPVAGRIQEYRDQHPESVILAQLGWLQLRTSHTSSRPKTAQPRPIMRKVGSGVPMTAAIERLAGPGNAAKIRPSMTKTSPTAARKSVMPGAAVAYFAGAGGAADALGAPGVAGILADGAVQSAVGLPDGLLK